MKLSISNIAWDTSADDSVGAFLREQNVTAIELAPTKYWPAPCTPSKNDILKVRNDWRRRGQDIVAMQSLLYGCDDLSIFGDTVTKRRTSDYLARIISIAQQLGARALVFGSPRNRDRGEYTHERATEEAADFFLPLAVRAAESGVAIGFEPNPERYRCNFCTTAVDAMQLVHAVNHPGFGINLDTAIAHINHENFAEAIRISRSNLVHVHISEPELAAINRDDVPHQDNATALRKAAWQHYVSIEMRGGGDELGRIRESIKIAKDIYHE